MSLNVIILIGNITRNPEIKYLASGTAVADFGLAVNEVYYDAAGQKIEKVCFVDITAWEKGAEWAEKYLEKGAEVCVEGKLTMDSWEDKETGAKRTKLKVTANKLTPTFGTWKEGKGEKQPQGRTAAPGRPTPPQSTRPAQERAATGRTAPAPAPSAGGFPPLPSNPRPMPKPIPPPPFDPALDGIDDDDLPF
jgi:single-strand DNA-binding protein